MNDEIKPPGEPEKPDEPFNESLNEEFDFGEETPPPSPVYSERKGPNKKLLMGGGVIVILLILAMGYKFLVKQKPTTPAPKVSSIKTQTPITRPASPSPTQQTSQEQSFSEIAQAFSSADNTAAGSTPAVGTGTNPPSGTKTPKEGSIQELQKELFTPETPPPTPPSSQVQTQGGGTTGPIPLLPVTKTVESSTETSLPANITEELHKLNQKNQYILNQIKYLDSFIKEVSDNLNKLTGAINGMETRVSTLTNSTTLLSKDIGSVKSEVGQVQRVLKEDGLDESTDVISPFPRARCETERKNGHAIIEEPEYVVHAVIPGRAWLKSLKGQIVTVTEGDTVGNYGKVLVIDAANGVVLTSSGITFR